MEGPRSLTGGEEFKDRRNDQDQRGPSGMQCVDIGPRAHDRKKLQRLTRVDGGGIVNDNITTAVVDIGTGMSRSMGRGLGIGDWCQMLKWKA